MSSLRQRGAVRPPARTDRGRSRPCGRRPILWLAHVPMLVLCALAIMLVVGRDAAGAAGSATVVVQNSAFEPLAVDRAGTLWGSPTGSPTELWRSTDEGRTWTKVTGWSSVGVQPWYVTPLSTGTLLVVHNLAN